jgi:hypothetical protein
MNILSIEENRNNLLNFLENSDSRRLKLKKISEFLKILIEQNQPNLINSYAIEFLPQYIELLKTYSPFGLNTAFTKEIISLNGKLIEQPKLSGFRDSLIAQNDDIKSKLNMLESILNNEYSDEDIESKVIFPVIEQELIGEEKHVLGAIDSLTIKVNKAVKRDRFIIVPSSAELDKKLENQIKICWEAAKSYCKKNLKKLNDYHEVLISFDGNLGMYTGDSMGTALAIAMIEELLKFYNSKTILKPLGEVAFTGAIKENGELGLVSKELIEHKVENIFFSKSKIFVLPKEDKIDAIEKLEQLSRAYPERKLELVGVEDLNEILLRRDLVEIKKQNVLVRSGKFVSKNWTGAAVAIILTAILTFLFAVDLDDNPVALTIDRQLLNVKNKNGKILWTKRVNIDLTLPVGSYPPKMIYKFEDINNDNRKELLLCFEIFDSLKEIINPEKIACYDYEGNQIWQYFFEDSVFTSEKLQQPIYTVLILDIRKEGKTKVLYALAKNTYYASAVFKLNAQTGERLDGTLWNAGHFEDGIVGDFNMDGKTEMVLSFINNGFERCGLVSINLEKMDGQLPTSDNYKFSNIGQVQFNRMVLLPVTDYLKYLGARFNFTLPGNLVYQDNVGFRIVTIESTEVTDRTSINYSFDKNLNCIDVECSDDIQIARDSLVARNILKKPFTNTIEYENLLKSEIVYK